MTQNKPRTTPQPPYLFEHVFRNLTGRFWINIFKPEILNIKKLYASKTIHLSSELFEIFPRSNLFYRQMICDLTVIANCDVTQCINYLFVAIGDIAMNRKSKAFDSINNSMPNDQFSAEIILKIKKLLLTDLICSIVSKMETMEQQSAKNLITCGIYFCMSQSQKDDFPNFLLKQWSVIFSCISILSENDLFERLTQLIINKYDLFFTLMRFVRLDKCSHANDILEIMTSHLKRAKRKNIITSSMFRSISIILSTYRGDENGVDKILDIAKDTIKKDLHSNPGAVDLIATLLPFSKDIKTDEFFEKCVYPLTQTEEGMLSAARSFRTMMFNNKLDPDFLFYVWSPTKRTNEFDFLKWEVTYTPEFLTEKFNTHLFPSPYINVCSTIIMQIIVKLAAMDFKNFIENIFPKFVNSDIDSPQFKVFLSIVPMINDERFLELSKGFTKDDVDQFNTEFANTTNNKMKIIINSLQGYTLHISDDYKIKAAKANKANTQTVLDAFNKLNIDIGTETNFQGEENKVQKDRDSNSNKALRIIPYLVNSKMFLTKEWMKSFVRLSALSDEEVSKPAYSICQSIFQQGEKRMEFCNVLIEMSLQIEQKMEILYMCISMLVEIIDILEPNTPKDDNAEEYNIEFVALLGLASSYPALRSISYDLLIKANKLLQNQGLYSQIEDHIPAIASNVNHNIMLQTFPKRPGKNEYTEDIFSFSNLLYSNYQEPWLFLLAEFGRVISYSKYNPMLKRIKEHCQRYINHIKDINDKEQEHLDLGLLSLFISTCTVKDYSENNLFVYEIPVKTDHNTESFSSELAVIIHDCFKYEKYHLIFKALKHVNYTVVPLIFNILKDILKESSMMTNSIQMKNFNINQNQTKIMNLPNLFLNILPSIHLMFSAIEGTKISCKQVQPIAIEIYFIICSDQNTMTMLQKMIETNSNDEENFRKAEHSTLCFLTFLNFCMECYIQVTSNDNNKNNNLFNEKKSTAAKLIWGYLCFLLTRNDKKNPKFITIKTYAAWVLQTIINKANKIIPMCKEPEIKTISNCERYGYSVLYPLLKLNTYGYFSFFANSCFRRKGLMADAFFSAIYQCIFELKRDNVGFKNFYNNQAGTLLLLGILRFKTGSPYAKDFLERFYDIYPQASQITSQKIPIEDIIKDPASHFERITEQVVKAALEQMKDKKFKGTIKVMVDILKKWIIKFRLLPNQKACIPSKVSYLVYKMYQFLNDLMEITINFRYNHDFKRIVDLWAILLKVKDNQYTVPVFITEYATGKETYTELKCELFKLLLEDKTMIIIPKTLAKRCKFAYYAYVTYQKKKDMDNEFWIVDVLITALKKCDDYIENFLPELLHFAILFHSNQTQSLLKRLCKRYNVLYTRRTLSTISVQHLVADFNKIISKIDEKRMKDFELSQQEEETKKHDESKKNQSPNINTYSNLNSILNPSNQINGLNFSSDSDSAFTTYVPQPTTKITAKPPTLDKKGLFFTGESSDLSSDSVSFPIQRSITPTMISQPFPIPKKSLNDSNSSAYVSDDSSVSEPFISSGNSSISSTDDEFDIPSSSSTSYSRQVTTIYPKTIKRSTGILPAPIRPKSTPPVAKKKKRSLNMKWAKEAMRWTIGTQNLRLAYMSIIILNSLQNYEMNQRVITELLLGICKSTAYFLSINENTEDKSLLYDFIDEAFKLFKRHFVGNERLAFNFIKSFLPFVVNVDAYFENMLPLFECCLSSEVTEKEAQPKLLDALRPYFNELESDSTAREAFSNFEKKATTNNVDIKFVKIVLRRALNIKAIQASQQQQMSPQQQQVLENKKEKNEDDDNNLIKNATNEQLNQAFLHYSLMVGNASADLKRRIFSISSKIIIELQNRQNMESSNERRPSMQESTENETDENLPLSPTATTTTTTTITKSPNISLQESPEKNKDNNYIDKSKEINQSYNKSYQESINNKSTEIITNDTETATATPTATASSISTINLGTTSNNNIIVQSPSTVSTTTTNDTGTATFVTTTNVTVPLNTAPVEPNQMTDPTKQGGNNNTEDENVMKNDLNAQALLVIFTEAADCLPWMKEAIEFIRNLSILYPLIPTVPLINDFGWGHAARVVVAEISKFAPKETINVSLVNCSNLNSLSILLTININDKKSHAIKVLPFSSILDTFPSNSKELKHSGFDDLTRKVMKVSTEFKNKIFKSLSPKADFFITGQWNVINFDPSASFIGENELWLKFKIEKKMSPLLSKEDFLSLEDE